MIFPGADGAINETIIGSDDVDVSLLSRIMTYTVWLILWCTDILRGLNNDCNKTEIILIAYCSQCSFMENLSTPYSMLHYCIQKQDQSDPYRLSTPSLTLHSRNEDPVRFWSAVLFHRVCIITACTVVQAVV